MTKKDEARRESRVRAALVSWSTLTSVIGELDEASVLLAMREETIGARRRSFIKRLTQRLNSIRVAQVKKEVDRTSEEIFE